MTLKILPLVIIAVILIAAASPNNVGKIKSIHLDRWKDTLSYQYDKDGNVVSITTGPYYKTTYSHKANVIIAETKGGSLVTMYLNSRGLVDSLADVDTNRKTIVTHHQQGMPDDEMLSFGINKRFPYSGNPVPDIEEIAGATTHGLEVISKKFVYDDQGFIREIRIYANKGRPIISTHVVKNGNIISYTMRYPVDTVSMNDPKTNEAKVFLISQDDFIVENTFDPAHLNTLETSGLFGRSSKNIVTRSVHRCISQNSKDSTVTTFKYTFDAANRVSTLVTAVHSTDPPEHNQDKEMEDACSFTYY